MKVIILENIENVGKKYEIKKVKAGFFRNYLLSKKLAKVVDKQSLLWLEKNRDMIQKEREREILEMKKIGEGIKDLNLVIYTKVGEKGQLFEKITNLIIAKKLNDLNYKINKKQILGEPIKKIGEYKIEINLGDKLSTFLNLKIENEKNREKEDKSSKIIPKKDTF